MSTRAVCWSVVLGLVTAACGGAAAPNERVTSATAAVRAAEVAGAPGNPEASLMLKRAQEGLTKAKALMADGNNEEASRVLQRAEADAELALNLAREAQAKAQAQAAIDQVQAFKQKSSE
jgi:hypothetical protein